jgi:rhodanese-related sulfurtransferase
MEEEQPTKDNEKKIRVILLIILIIISVISIVFLTVHGNWTEQKPIEKRYTSSYTSITAKAAYDFINTTTNNLTIIDVRNCKCNYNKGHIGDIPLFEAIHNNSWYDYYNTTDDLLIYDTFGNQESIEFCENLVNHTYGKILHLDGGITAWKNSGFPTI